MGEESKLFEQSCVAVSTIKRIAGRLFVFNNGDNTRIVGDGMDIEIRYPDGKTKEPTCLCNIVA